MLGGFFLLGFPSHEVLKFCEMIFTALRYLAQFIKYLELSVEVKDGISHINLVLMDIIRYNSQYIAIPNKMMSFVDETILRSFWGLLAVWMISYWRERYIAVSIIWAVTWPNKNGGETVHKARELFLSFPEIFALLLGQLFLLLDWNFLAE